MKILLIDDDAFLRDMYATKFGEKGHTVDVAPSVEIALTKLHEKKYDVVLTDVIMPGMTGIQLIEKIFAETLASKPMCIMLSNQTEESEKQAALAAGAVGYIVKAELIPSEVVEEVLRLVSK